MPEGVYKLRLKGPLHVGTWGIGREETLNYVPSDTLFGALVVAWASLGLPVEDALSGGPAASLRVTSAFPFAGPVRFFPRPLRSVDWPADLPFKRIKQAAWVSEALFHALRRGELPRQHLDERLNFVQAGRLWLTAPEREAIGRATGLPDYPGEPAMELRLWREATAARVAVDRASRASNLFHTGRVSFAGGCGLWLAARGDDLAPLEAGLDYLQDTGLGGLRATGHGAFEWSAWPEVPPLPPPGDGGYFVTLARYAPAAAEFERTLRAPQAAFRLETVAGWCLDDANKPWRRRRVRLVAEGAYLGWPGSTPGRLVDVTPEGAGDFRGGRRVYRYGLAFPVADA
jgi:CRISPR-associated protein Csm4